MQYLGKAFLVFGERLMVKLLVLKELSLRETID